MSEEVRFFNYEYQGQVYSPAFSDPPPSPMSTASDRSSSSSSSSTSGGEEQGSNCEERASNKVFGLSLGDSGGSNEPSGFGDEAEEGWGERARTLNNPSDPQRKPKYPTKYHEMLQPLSPVTTLSPEPAVRPVPLRTHRTNVDPSLQEEFLNLLGGNNLQQESLPGCESFPRASNHCSSVAGMEEFLFRHSERIDINQYNKDGQTPLQLCCLLGDLPMAKLLVRFGANSRLTTREGFSTLHIAAFGGNVEILGFVMSLKNAR